MEDSELRQENIMIGGVEVPTIHYEGDVWYPANYINRFLFKRSKGSKMITKENELKLNDLCRAFDINFGYNTGGIQNCKCINKDGFYLVLKYARIGSYNKDQKRVYNELINYFQFDIPLILEEDTINNKDIDKVIKGCNIFIQDCIKSIMKIEPNIKWRKCNRCGNIYPLHKCFFDRDNNKNVKREIKFLNFCKECGESNGRIHHIDNDLDKIYREYGEKYYSYYINHNTLKIYDYCKRENLKLPNILCNKIDYLTIIKFLYSKGHINNDNITLLALEENFNLRKISQILKNEDIYSGLFGEDYWQVLWRYKSLSLHKLTYEEAKVIFNNYLSEFNIKIEDIFTFKYNDILHKARLTQIESDVLSFVVYYYDYKYAGYKFKISSSNYWKNKEHRIFDMKYFIEQEIKVPIDKIPLYITKNVLQKRARTLYTLLNNGSYYKNLYEWINEVYPDKFIESDFVIGSYRDKFDSVEESQINDILYNNFENVIYNQINTDRTISFSGNKTPDWFIFTNKGVILVEYFGLYVPDRMEGSSVIRDYIERSDKKKEIYNKLEGYKLLYFYPEDLDDNFKGVLQKIEDIKKIII